VKDDWYRSGIADAECGGDFTPKALWEICSCMARSCDMSAGACSCGCRVRLAFRDLGEVGRLKVGELGIGGVKTCSGRSKIFDGCSSGCRVRLAFRDFGNGSSLKVGELGAGGVKSGSRRVNGGSPSSRVRLAFLDFGEGGRLKVGELGTGGLKSGSGILDLKGVVVVWASRLLVFELKYVLGVMGSQGEIGVTTSAIVIGTSRIWSVGEKMSDGEKTSVGEKMLSADDVSVGDKTFGFGEVQSVSTVNPDFADASEAREIVESSVGASDTSV